MTRTYFPKRVLYAAVTAVYVLGSGCNKEEKPAPVKYENVTQNEKDITHEKKKVTEEDIQKRNAKIFDDLYPGSNLEEEVEESNKKLDETK